MSDRPNKVTIIRTFSSHGFSLTPSALKACLAILGQTNDPEILSKLIESVYTLLKLTNKENIDSLDEIAVEEAWRIAQGKQGKDGSSNRNDKSAPDRIAEKMAEIFIVLSNFGELPQISFRNQVRNLTVNYGRERETIVPGKELIEKWIDKYHKMKYLVRNCGDYIYEHDLQNRTTKPESHVTVLIEIGSMHGHKGVCSVFGLVFKQGKKVYIQDTLSTVEVSLDSASFKEGYYHEKHFLILTGEMMTSHFKVSHVSHPYLDGSNPQKITQSMNTDLFGYKTKYLSIMKDTAGDHEHKRMDIEGARPSQKQLSTLSKRFLGLYEFNSKPSGQILIFSDFNIQDQSNLKLLEYVIISMGIREEANIEESSKPDSESSLNVDAIILCGPFTENSLINSKEDQAALEDSFKQFANLLTKTKQYLKQTIIGLVPDLEDPVMKLHPRKSLPDYLFNDYQNSLPQLCLFENPLHFSHFVSCV